MSLPQADVDLAKGLVHIRRGKTKAAKRTLKLTTESKAILAARLDGGTWIFKGKKAGTHLTCGTPSPPGWWRPDVAYLHSPLFWVTRGSAW